MFPNHANAWREILQRIFSDFTLEENVTPDWLVNPETGRRLKLDRYYPEAGIAFRLTGSTGKRKAPVSEQEIEDEARRNEVRDRLCAEAGVTLISVDIYGSEPRAVLRDIRSALSRSMRLTAQGREPAAAKRDRAECLSRAKRTCDSLTLRVRSADDLSLYADLWEDRQYAASKQEAAAESPQRRARHYAANMRVRHERFGDGAVAEVRRDSSGEFIVVQFDDGSQKVFAASLVQDKLKPIRG